MNIMKKKIFTLLVLLAAAVSGAWAEDVQVGRFNEGDNKSNSYILPINSVYSYSYSQQIYTAAEIGKGGTIKGITLWLYGSDGLLEMPFDVYMKEVDKEEFGDSNDWVPLSVTDKVCEDTLKVSNATPKPYYIKFDKPFVYSGERNLLLAINSSTGDWKHGLYGMVFKALDTKTRTIYARQDAQAYNPAGPAEATGITRLRNVVKFDIRNNWPLAVETNAHGTFAFKNAAGENIANGKAMEGDEVTMTITPDDGYTVKEVWGEWSAPWEAATSRGTGPSLQNRIEMTPVEGNPDTWTFSMPYLGVEFNATYKKLLTNADITITDIQDVTYNSQVLMPTFVVKDGQKVLKNGVDYTVTYDNNVNAGEATSENAPSFTITAMPDNDTYAGERVQTFTINRRFTVIYYDSLEISKNPGDAPFTNWLTYGGDGMLTYTISGSDIATVNERTGEVTLTGEQGAFAVIATIEESDNYLYDSRTAAYVVTVGMDVEKPVVKEGDDPVVVANRLALKADVDKAKAIEPVNPQSDAAKALAAAIKEAEKLITADNATLKKLQDARLALAQAIEDLDGETTGIKNLNVNVNDNWYDLNGRRVANGQLKKGVYIKNGKKVVIK